MADKNMPQQQPQKIHVNLDEKIADGHYANLVLINHSPAEFVLDFARIMPQSAKTNVQTRVILAPMHAKNLLRALEDNIKRYEANHGEIRLPGKTEDHKSFGFQA